MDDLTFKRLNEVNEKRALEWQNGEPTDHKWLEFAVIELAGEAGEAADAVKKLLRYFKDMPGGVEPSSGIPAIADELADVVICADRVAQTLDIDLGSAVVSKFNRTSTKHEFVTKL